MSSLVSSIFGGGKKAEAAPVVAPAAPAARPADAALREQQTKQRVTSADAAEDGEVDSLGYAPPKKRQAGREILG